MSTVPKSLGYAGGRSGHFSSSTMQNHAFRGTNSALSNTFGGGVAGNPTPGMYRGMAYPGGRSGNNSNYNNTKQPDAFRGASNFLFGNTGTSTNMFWTGMGLLAGVVVIEAFRTRRAVTGIKMIDKPLKQAAKVVEPITKPVKKAADKTPLLGDVVSMMDSVVPGR